MPSHSPLLENLSVIWSGAWVSVVFKKPFYFDMLLNLQRNCKTNAKSSYALYSEQAAPPSLHTHIIFVFPEPFESKW